ncbi:MAG: hypothetical protein JKY50_07255 [Oleispira sp.]|nr:hypothetical protein [Oleispira sp.]MBL4881202.1 hypothetical protein [Oleispira sp.]
MSEFFKITPGTSLRDAVREEIKRQPHGVKAACAVIGVTHPQTLSNYTCNTKRDTHNMSLDQFESIIEWSGGGCIAQAVAEMAGGVFLPMQIDDFENVDVLAEVVASIESVSNLVNEVKGAIEDRSVDDNEWSKIRSAKFKLSTAANRLVALCSQMRE